MEHMIKEWQKTDPKVISMDKQQEMNTVLFAEDQVVLAEKEDDLQRVILSDMCKKGVGSLTPLFWDIEKINSTHLNIPIFKKFRMKLIIFFKKPIFVTADDFSIPFPLL